MFPYWQNRSDCYRNNLMYKTHKSNDGKRCFKDKMFLKWSIKNQFCPIIFCWTLVQFSRIRASWEVFNIEVCISVSCMNLVTYKMCKSNDGKRGFKDKMNHREALIPYKASDSFYLTPTKTHSTFKWTKLKSLEITIFG